MLIPDEQISAMKKEISTLKVKLVRLVSDKEPNGYPLWFNREVRDCPGCDSEDLCMGHLRMARRNFVGCEKSVEAFLEKLKPLSQGRKE